MGIIAPGNSTDMEIVNSTIEDLPEIFSLYKAASLYQQQQQSVVVWQDFDIHLVETEIADNRQWKLIIEGQIACIWAITFSDAQIWEERNADPAIYIHRIATNPSFRGQQLINKIVSWAKIYALSHDKSYVRLDTSGNNLKLIKHYTNAGFTFLGVYDLKDTQDLPIHYQNMPASLFEIKLV